MYAINYTSLRIVRRYPLGALTSTKYSNNLSRSILELPEEDRKKIINRATHGGPNFANLDSQVYSVLKEVKMEDMKQSPPAVFWTSMGTLVPIATPSILMVIAGYSPALVTAQLTFSATALCFLAGARFGFSFCTEDSKLVTWENTGWSLVPLGIGWFALMAPQAIGALLISFGMALSAFIDVTATPYPRWFKSIRLAFTAPVIGLLLLTFLMRLFH